MTLADAYGAIFIVGIVTAATLCSELVSYMLVYETEEYKRLCKRIQELNKKLAKEDEKVVSLDKRKNHEKAIERIEDELQTTSRRIDAMKMKTNIIAAVSFFFLYRMVAAAWTGVPVARLPFMPVKFVQNLSFRGLPGDDKYQCSFGLIYTLCTLGVKANIPKAFGFVSPKSAYDASRMAAREARKSS